jgi:hypothetical protein
MQAIWAHIVEIAGILATLGMVIYNYGKLNTRVDVLWHTVFNHMGQDPIAATASWKRVKTGKINASDIGAEK